MLLRSIVGGALAAVLTTHLPFASAWPAEPYEIPVLLPLTGPGAFLGQGEQTALQFVEAAVNKSGGIAGRPLKFVVRDDQSNPQIAVQLATEIIDSKPSVLLGSSLTANCRAVAPLVQRGGPMNYCFSPGIRPEPGSYSFSANIQTRDLVEAQIRYFRLKGWKRVAFIVSTDATGQDAENAVTDVMARPENKEMSLVSVAHYNISDLSVSAQIESIKAANPQCLIAWGSGTPIATVFRAIVDAGLSVPVETTSANMTYSQMMQYKAILPKELYFSVSQWVVRDPAQLAPDVAEAHALFYATYDNAGRKPDVSSDLAWDPAMIVITALRKLGPTATAPEVREFLEHLDHYPGVDGAYNFVKVPQRGLDASDAVVARWDGSAERWIVVSKPGGVPLEQ